MDTDATTFLVVCLVAKRVVMSTSAVCTNIRGLFGDYVERRYGGVEDPVRFVRGASTTL